MPEDELSIAVNKGVCNTLDATVCTTSVGESEASTCEWQPLTDWRASAKPKNNGKRAWPIWSAGPLFRARKFSTYSPVVKGVAHNTDWARVTTVELTTSLFTTISTMKGENHQIRHMRRIM